MHLQLRPEMTAQLKTTPDLFKQIVDSIPEKSLNKLSHLIPELFDETDDKFEDFGKEYTKTLEQRLEKYRRDNQLSDKSDEQLFEFLEQNCCHFNQTERISADILDVI